MYTSCHGATIAKTICTIVSQNVAVHTIMVSDVTISHTNVTIAVLQQHTTGNINDYLVISSKCYSRYWKLESERHLGPHVIQCVV